MRANRPHYMKKIVVFDRYYYIYSLSIQIYMLVLEAAKMNLNRRASN